MECTCSTVKPYFQTLLITQKKWNNSSLLLLVVVLQLGQCLLNIISLFHNNPLHVNTLLQACALSTTYSANATWSSLSWQYPPIYNFLFVLNTCLLGSIKLYKIALLLQQMKRLQEKGKMLTCWVCKLRSMQEVVLNHFGIYSANPWHELCIECR